VRERVNGGENKNKKGRKKKKEHKKKKERVFKLCFVESHEEIFFLL